MNAVFDYTVLGAGIMGLETARLLSKKGQKVALIDKSSPGREASWAAAGILVRRGMQHTRSLNRQLYCDSIASYPEWVKELETDSGLSISIHQEGDYCFMFQTQATPRFIGRLKSEGAQFEELDTPPKELQATKPEGSRLFYFKDEMYVNNRELLLALILECEKSENISPYFSIESIELEFNSNEIKLDFGNGQSIQTKHLAITSGYWSYQALKQIGWEPPLQAVKGQVYSIPSFYPSAAMVHLDDNHYCVPRGDQVLIGATSEFGNEEKDLTQQGRLELEKSIQRVFPQLKINEYAHGWAGIRPRSEDTYPLVGFLEDRPNISMNFGHFRSGISMAPLSCRRYVDGLLEGKMPESLSPYDPHRGKGLKPLGVSCDY